MSTDIRLDDHQAIIDAPTLKVNGWDLVVDGGDQRRPNDKNFANLRRALVHDFNDGLTINFAGDYPGGVAIRGQVSVSDKLLLPIREFAAPTKPGELAFHEEMKDVAELLMDMRAEISRLSSQVRDLRVRSTITAEASHYTQGDWRWCRKCSGLHYSPNRSHGICQTDQKPHEQEPGPGFYVLFADKSRYGGQPGWRCCYRCQLVCWGETDLAGCCPAGGQHDRSRSPNYLLWHPGAQGNVKDFPAQPDWRWCNRCHGLFHGGAGGSCAAPNGGVHNSSGSFDYHLQTV